MSGLAAFHEVWMADFEYSAPPGDHVTPICLVAREYHSGKVVRLFGDDLRRCAAAPFDVGDDALFIAYNAAAEIGCFLVLGWPLPTRILDLYVEFRATTNGLRVGERHGLLDAMTYYGLDGIDASEKESMRNLTLRGEPFDATEREALLIYCESDVTALAKLLPCMLHRVDMPRALLRGRYMAAVAEIHQVGVPIDVPALRVLEARWSDVKEALIRDVDVSYGVYEGQSFNRQRFAHYLAGRDIAWPVLDSGLLALNDDTFREMASIHPVIEPLWQLRKTLGQLRLTELVVGPDGRSRASLFPFTSKTSRNQPSNTKFVFGLPSWVRGLVRPPEGRALAYVDYEQQEFGIAAALSGDAAMMEAYASGDPYLAFAIQAGAVPPTATKKTHEAERDRFKACVLGVQYCMEAATLARRIGQSQAHAAELLRLHRATYPVFWRWVRGAVDYALLRNEIHTVFGWTLRLGADPNTRSIQNFPMQSNGAEMLRLACSLATERGIRVCAPIHDALLVEAPADRIDEVVAETQAAMREASEIVLGGFALRADAKIVRHPQRYADKRGADMWARVWKLLGVSPDALSIAASPDPEPVHGCNKPVHQCTPALSI